MVTVKRSINWRRLVYQCDTWEVGRKEDGKERGREGGREKGMDSKVDGNKWRGEGVMKVQWEEGGGTRDRDRARERKRLVLTPVIALMYDLI